MEATGWMVALPAAILLIVASFSVLVWFGIPWAGRRLQTARLAARCAARRAIVLSYDDSPGAVVTSALADLLARHGVRASFYAIGREALARPDLVARLLAEGHEIGSHTQDHRNAWKSLPWVTFRDIRAGQRSLDRLGVPPGSFRPPFGKTTPATLVALWRQRAPLAFWTVDSRDSWEDPRPIAEVLSALETQSGGVLLMHDCDRPLRARSGHDHRAYVLALTEAVIDLAARRGFAILRFCDLEEPLGPTRGPAETRR